MRIPSFVLAIGAIAVVMCSLGLADDAATKEAERNAALEKSLSGSAMVGQFTVSGLAPESPKTERYELAKVTHLEGEMWSFQARMRYGDKEVPLPPLALPIRWAGDTPVITVDNLAIPGAGTYTARVMIYQDHYAGFWTGKDHGGHLFGVIEHGDADKAKEAENHKGTKDAK